MTIAPDTLQNIKVMIDLIFLHNFAALMYALGIFVSLIISIYKPSRAVIFMLLGFILLLFAFEYSKHIVGPLTDQTLGSLITLRQSPTTERIVRIFLTKIIPLVLPIIGWILIILGILGGSFNLKKSNKKKGESIQEHYSITPQQRKLLNQMLEYLNEFKHKKTTLNRLLGNLEATLKAGEFDKAISFAEWYTIANRLDEHSRAFNESVEYKQIKTDIDTMHDFLKNILKNST